MLLTWPEHLQGMLKHTEDKLDGEIQGALTALALVASEATLEPYSEKLLDTTAWSQPAVLVQLNSW